VLHQVPEYIQFVDTVTRYFPETHGVVVDDGRIIRHPSTFLHVFSHDDLVRLYDDIASGVPVEDTTTQFLLPLQSQYPQLFFLQPEPQSSSYRFSQKIKILINSLVSLSLFLVYSGGMLL
jgi:hypothetical protein